MNATAIKVDAVSFAYGMSPALHDVSCGVPSGVCYGLLGPNGSGKSTLFRLLSTLLPLQSGSITVLGLDLRTQQSQVRRQIGVTFQSPAVDVRLTVLENLRCHAAIYGLTRAVSGERIRYLLERFRIADRAGTVVGQLSGGLKRRVELVKGLLHQPRVLLLDEPTSGLDLRSRLEFFELLHEQRRESGTTVVLATHLMEEAEHCEQLLLLDKGRVVAAGSPEQLKASVSGERLTIRCRDAEAARGRLSSLLGCQPTQSGQSLVFRLQNSAANVSAVLAEPDENILAAELARPSLEDVFLSLTGRMLNEQEAEG